MKKIYNKTNQEWHLNSLMIIFGLNGVMRNFKAIKSSGISLNNNYNCLMLVLE